MGVDELLRMQALNDLRRLTPKAHFWMRDLDPKADRELTEPLLREPVQHGMTPRELAAAHALANRATYLIRSRELQSRVMVVSDSDAPQSDPRSMPESDYREIAARREVFRQSALVYARMVNEPLMIEAFAGPQPDSPYLVSQLHPPSVEATAERPLDDFAATIQVAPTQTLWRAADVPNLTADALYRFEPSPDPVIPATELRRFSSADPQCRDAGRPLNSRELAGIAKKCRAAGLPEMPGELSYSRWGEYLEAFNHDAESRGWWAGLVPQRDPNVAERISWVIAADEHRKLLRQALMDGTIQARMAGTNVPSGPTSVALDRLVLTREGFAKFAGLLAIQVVNEPTPVLDVPQSAAVTNDDPKAPDTNPKPIARFAAQEKAILAEIRARGLNPRALPKWKYGEPGIKTEIAAALKGSSLFVGPRIFPKAWERLRDSGEIADDPSPALG